jgi:hypothetical protein
MGWPGLFWHTMTAFAFSDKAWVYQKKKKKVCLQTLRLEACQKDL